MTANHYTLSPEVAASPLTLAAEVFAKWQAGGRVVMDESGINVNGILFWGAALTPGERFDMDRNPKGDNLPNIFKFDGKVWTLQFDGTVVFEADRVGLHYIEQLLQRPHKEIYATNLVTGAYGEPEEIVDAKELLESGVATTEVDENEMADGVDIQVVTTEFRDEILPAEDRAIVLGLLDKSRVELATLKANGLVTLIPDKEWEIAEIEKYLAKTRFGSKNVCFDTRADKDRKSVAKAIKEASLKIANNHPSLAQHLRDSIKTGKFCSYEPKPEIYWEVAKKWRAVAPTK